MQRFEPFSESDCQQLCREVAALIAPLADKYGVRLDFVKDACSKGADSVAIHARFSLPDRPDSVATLKEELDYKCYAEGFGLQAAWLGREFTRGKFTFKVAGLNIAAPKKCVVLQRSDGARCQQDGKLVARYLG